MEWGFRNEKESYCHDYFLCCWIFVGCFSMTVLDELIEAVESGNVCPSTKCLPKGCGQYVQHAAKGSLDAALALHEALLPGKDYSIDTCNGSSSVTIWDHLAELSVVVIDAPIPARSWLLAILKAYRSLNA